MNRFSGIYPALITPFDEDGKINTDALQKVIQNNIDKGVNGFYVSGSTGESYLLSVDERKYLLEAVKEVTQDNVDVIVNIGMFATMHSMELAKHAEKQGVAAISSVPPFYFPFTKEEYNQYYKDLAEGSDVPVIVYNIPAMSSVHFTTEDLSRLLEHKSIAGVKHTSYDLFQLQRLIEKFPEKDIFIGHDEIYLSALSVGVKAGIGSTYNIMAEKFILLNKLFEEKKMDEALKVQNEINEVVSVLCEVGVFKGIKEILRLQGTDCGVCRKPFLPLSEEQRQRVKAVAEKTNII